MKKAAVCVMMIPLLLLPVNPFITGIGIEKGFHAESLEKQRHIIEGVPYVPQSDYDYYCNYACCAMVLQYLGINTTLNEVLHHTGLGYSFAARPRMTPTKDDDFPYPIGLPRCFRCWCGQETSLGEEDAQFLASLYGLSCEFIYPDMVINGGKCWNEYWDRVKNYILMDIPVCTSIDFTMLPYYVELFNLSGKGYHYSHSIVIVGFDEMNGTVYYNDPLCAAKTSAEDGKYAEVSIDIFRKAIYSVHWCIWNGWEEGYTTLAFKKIGKPLPKERAFELAHERNIRRMKGNASAYDKQSCKENFYAFGIDALKAMKKDFGLNFVVRAPFLIFITRLYPYMSLIIQSHEFAIIEKHNVSQYLQENSNLSPICEHDAILLDAEVEYWKEIKSYLEEMKEIMNNSLLKVILYSGPILQNITKTIDKIIDIEMDIISG